MAAIPRSQAPPHAAPAPPTICRPASPPPDVVPTLAVKRDAAHGAHGAHNATGELARCLSTASTTSLGSATTDASSLLSLGFVGRDSRDSLGSDASSSALSLSRHSSGSYYAAAASSLPLPPPSPALSARSASGSASKRLSTASTITTATTSTAGHGHGGHHAGGHSGHTKRRGYMRPQGTDFAASARSRESVLSLGSIAHLQHYFARTGLLDLKGQLERRRRNGKARTLDWSQLEGASGYLAAGSAAPTRAQSMLLQLPAATGPKAVASDTDSSYASMGSSPELAAHGARGGGGGGAAGAGTADMLLVESPIQDDDAAHDWYTSPDDGHFEDGGDAYDDDGNYDDDDDDDDDEDAAAAMLPPTVSTYMHREKPLPKPPSLAELRADLRAELDSAAQALAEAREAKANNATPAPSAPASPAPARSPKASAGAGAGAAAAATTWYEIQGMHILDVMTLAIRAAKVYYTGHEHPDRLDAIKPERTVRSELLGVMDVLKRMATRNFAGGVRTDELRAMDAWVAGVYAMLAAEDDLVAAERTEQAGWSWLHDADWPAAVRAETPAADRLRAYAREQAFLQSMLSGGGGGDDRGAQPPPPALPEWVPMARGGSDGTAPTAPTAFLRHMQNGVCLVQLHNCAVRKSRRRFGAIPTFHADTQKPYRAADNLRYWVKAAELRWEVLLKIDALGVACGSRPAAAVASSTPAAPVAEGDIWPAFEDAIYQWCRKVREEIAADVV